MEEKKVIAPRGEVYYWISKNTEPGARCLVFLHGLSADHTLFEKQIEYFAPKHTVITWDAPAHGKSRPYRDFSYANAAADLCAILDAEGINRAVMIGQSMGGYVIQSFLQKYPERAEAFVAIDSCPFGTGYYSKSDMRWLRQIEWMSMCYPHKLLVKSLAKQCTATERGYENMLAALAPYGKRELCALMGLGYAGFLKENRDIKINCPVLLLVGESDVTGKVRQYNEAWHAREGYPLHIIENAAHNSNIDNPERVNALIDEFLSTLNTPEDK